MKRLLMMIGAAAVAVGVVQNAAATELVTNGSFETYTGTIGNGGIHDVISASLVLDGWTRDPDGGNVGLSTASDTIIWKNVANVKGNIACFFQKNASLSQTINVAEAGTYRVSFRYASRLSPQYYGNGRFYIEIDGTEVGHADCGTSTTFQTALMETELTVGEHTLVIRHSNELSTDAEKRANSVIDGISITPKTDLLFNGGFEGYIGVIPSDHHVTADASHNADGWIGTSYGLSETSSPFLEGGSGSPFEGSAAVHFNGLTELSQNVEISDAGVYEISFVYAPRDKTHYAGGRVNVWIDGEKVGYADSDPITTKFRSCRVRTQIAAGSHVFKLSHTLDNPVSGSNTPCTAIDDVSIVKVDDGNLIANGGFENYIGTLSGIQSGFSDSFLLDGWKYETSGEGLATTNSNYLAETKGSPFEGNVSLYFNSSSSHLEHSVSQTVYVAESGDYEMSFVYAPRDNTYYYGGRIWVLVDGEEVGEYADCDNSTMAFRRHAFRMSLSSGLHVIELKHGEGESIGKNCACSAIDDVALKAADNLIMNGSFDLGTVDDSKRTGGNWEVWSDGGCYSNPGWTLSGSSGLAKPGYPSAAPWVSSNLSPTGVYSLFLQTANYSYNGTTRTVDAASAQQTFDVVTPGVYELRFSYASRPYNNYKGGTIYARVYKGEGTEGVLIWERFVTANSLTSFEEFSVNVKFYDSGKYTLQFYAPQPEYSTTAANERDSVIDNVSLTYQSDIKGTIIMFY